MDGRTTMVLIVWPTGRMCRHACKMIYWTLMIWPFACGVFQLQANQIGQMQRCQGPLFCIETSMEQECNLYQKPDNAEVSEFILSTKDVCLRVHASRLMKTVEAGNHD